MNQETLLQLISIGNNLYNSFFASSEFNKISIILDLILLESIIDSGRTLLAPGSFNEELKSQINTKLEDFRKKIKELTLLVDSNELKSSKNSLAENLKLYFNN